MVSGVGIETIKVKLLRAKLKAPEAYSGLVFGVGTEKMKMKLLRLILAWFPEWAQKGSK